MDSQEDLKRLVGQYGIAAVAVMKQIADYLKVLQVERPELFVNGVLVEDWVVRLQDKPLPPAVLPPQPEPIVYPSPVTPVSPVTPASAESIAAILQKLQKAMGEFGANAMDVMKKIAAFISKLQVDRPDLFENGVLVADWSTRIQTKPSVPLILPVFDPNLIPDTVEPVVEPAKPVVVSVDPVVVPVKPVEEPTKPVVVPVLPDIVLPITDKPKSDPPIVYTPATTTSKPTANKDAIKFELDRIRSAITALYALVDGLN